MQGWNINSILREQIMCFKELFTSEGINVAAADSLLSTVDARLTDDEKNFGKKCHIKRNIQNN